MDSPFAKALTVAVIAIIAGFVGGIVAPQDENLAGVSRVQESFTQGFTVGDDETSAVMDASGNLTAASVTNSGASTVAGDATISGGTLNVTTSNTATSTVVAGCFQFYATSTATPLKFQASTTPGVMYSQYGTCPNG